MRTAEPTKVFLVVVTLVVIILSVVAILHPSTQDNTSTSTTSQGFAPIAKTSNTQNTATTTSTQRTANSTFSPPGVPSIWLNYEQMVFSGRQGSYCWSFSSPSSPCVTESVPLNTSAVPTVAVYPQPSIAFEIGPPAMRQSPNGAMSYTLYTLNPLHTVLSESGYQVQFNFTSGDYLLAVNFTASSESSSDYFLLSTVAHEDSAVNHGLRVEIGGLNYDPHDSLSMGSGEITFVGVESWSVTVYSNVTTNIELSSLSVMLGTWAEFVPSHLANVGPNGTQTDLLIAGAVRPFENNDMANVSLIVRGTGSDGSWGQATLPLEGGSLVIPIAPGGSVVAQNPRSWLATTGSTQYDSTFGLAYDLGGMPSNATTTASIAVDGMVSGGQLEPLPSWLTLSPEFSNLTLQAYKPNYDLMSMTTTAQAPLGSYYVLLDITTSVQHTYALIEIEVTPPVIH